MQSYLLQDKPFGQPSSGVSSPYQYAGPTPKSEEQYRPQTTEQDSSSRYQSQNSVPYGEEEQSSPKDQPSPNQPPPNSFSPANSLSKEQHVHGKTEQQHLSDPQSSPSSFGIENTRHKELFTDDKIKPQNVSDPPQSPSSSTSIPMATSQGTSRDSGQDNAPNGALNNGDPVRPGRQSWTDGAILDTSSQSCVEKIPVERVMSNDYHDEAAHHLNKCPVEMNYNCISKYFNRGGKNLGKGGFGIVYKGKMVKYTKALWCP